MKSDSSVSRKKNVNGQSIVAHWRELDIGLLLREAQRIGFPHDRLEILAQRKLETEISNQMNVRL